MAAPATTNRATPTGFKFEDGFSAKIAFARKPGLNIWEIDTGQPGMDNGEPIDTTTQHQVRWRTFSARSLVTLMPFTVVAAYDPICRGEFNNDLLGQEGSITVHYPDGSKLDFYGYLQKVEFDPLTEGEFPKLTATIVPTNYDPVNRVEAAPVLTLVSGT